MADQGATNRRRSTASQRVADGLRTAIADGDYRPGDPLPAYRALAATYGVAVNTVMAAVRQLAEQGLVDIKPNSGVEVRATSNEAAYGLADLRADARGIASELLDASQTLASLAKRVEDLQDRAKRLDIK